MQENQEITRDLTTGRRKEAKARVQLLPGTGQVTVNKKPASEYFASQALQLFIMQPLTVVQLQDKYDVIASIRGGGKSGQAGALRHGLARALVQADANLRPALLKAGLLTRDPRMRERKKYGQKGARKRFQWTKR